MASLISKPGQQAFIRLSLGTKRPKITLGWIGKENRHRRGRKITLKQAQQAKDRIELLETKLRLGCVIDDETRTWLTSLDASFYGRLVELGLTVPRAITEEAVPQVPTIAESIERFISVKQSTVSEGSVRKMRFAFAPLEERLGGGTKLDVITVGTATEWDSWLAGKGHSDAHRRTLARYAKQLFQFAIDDGIIEDNPFRKLKSSAIAGERSKYVTPEDAYRLLHACDDAERVFIGLARFAGLRVPSETHAVEWRHVDWHTKSLVVPCKKTQRFKGSTRVVPILPELMEILVDADKKLLEGGPAKIVQLSPHNLNRRFAPIVKKTFGLAWPKLFQTLRQSCETHLVALGWPPHAVAQWLGHSEQVSKDHYLMVSDEMFQLATKTRTPLSPSGVRHGVQSEPIQGNPGASMGVAADEAQNAKSLGNQGFHAEFEVARDGIEPPTRGFSILCSTN